MATENSTRPQLAAFEPILTEAMAKTLGAPDYMGDLRRMTLIAAARSSDDLRKSASTEQGRRVLMEIIEHVMPYVEYQKQMLELTTVVVDRLFLVSADALGMSLDGDVDTDRG